MIHPLTMIERSELFSLPPLGHAGVIEYNQLPEGCAEGADISFQLFGQEIMHGQIYLIEAPGRNARKETERSKYKVHWFPTTPPVPKTPAHQCPKGCRARSAIYMTIKGESTIQRYRRCPTCKIRWITQEVMEQILTSKVRKRK